MEIDRDAVCHTCVPESVFFERAAIQSGRNASEADALRAIVDRLRRDEQLLRVLGKPWAALNVEAARVVLERELGV